MKLLKLRSKLSSKRNPSSISRVYSLHLLALVLLLHLHFSGLSLVWLTAGLWLNSLATSEYSRRLEELLQTRLNLRNSPLYPESELPKASRQLPLPCIGRKEPTSHV